VDFIVQGKPVVAITTFEELLRNPSTSKVYLCELNPAIVKTNWAFIGDTNLWWVEVTEGPVNKVKVKGVYLVNVASQSAANTTPGSWYYESATQVLYVHLESEVDPNTSLMLVFFWIYFATASKYFADTKYQLVRYYKPLLQQESIPSISAEVKPLYSGASVYSLSFSEITIMNDGWYNTTADSYLWKNKNLLVKMGGEDLPFNEYQTVFSGLIRDDTAGSGVVSFSLNDGRIGLHTELPLVTYSIVDYPNLETGAAGSAIPIAYGTITNIKPVCVDCVNREFRVAGHPIKAVDWVKSNKVLLVEGVGYTVDLVEATITLLGTLTSASNITCQIQGKELSAGVLMTNASDIVKDLFITYLGVLGEDLDDISFAASKANRTFEISLYINNKMNSSEIVRTLDQSVVAQTIADNSGKIAFVAYMGGSVGATNLSDSDFGSDFSITREVDPIYYKVRVKYYKDPILNLWYDVECTFPDVLSQYDIQKTLSIETYLRKKADAENVAFAYGSLLSAPIKVAATTVTNVRPFNLKPTDKVIFTKDNVAAGITGSLVNSVYRVLKVDRNFGTGQAKILAIDDVQSFSDNLCVNCYSCQKGYAYAEDCTLCFSCMDCYGSQACTLCFACEEGVASSEECTLCYTCMEGVDTEGTCTTCYSCMECNVSQACVPCFTCQVCFSSEGACDVCVTREAPCTTCYTCEKCNTTQSGCGICVTDQGGCDHCYTAEVCVAAQKVCSTCDACEHCVTAEAGCFKCVAAQVCPTCQNCNTNQGGCQDCKTCMTCVTAM